jgi:hypothetical protein
MTTKKPKTIVLKFSNCYRRSFCFFCDQFDRPDIFDAFVEGTWDRVCPQCLDAQMGTAELSRAVRTMSGLLYLALRAQDAVTDDRPPRTTAPATPTVAP